MRLRTCTLNKTIGYSPGMGENELAACPNGRHARGETLEGMADHEGLLLGSRGHVGVSGRRLREGVCRRVRGTTVGRGWQREESCRGGAGRGLTLRLGHHTRVRCSPFCTAHALGPPVLIPEMDAEMVGAEGMWARLP